MIDVQSFWDLNEQWFLDHSAVKDPGAAWQEWRKWLDGSRGSDPWPMFCKLLEKAGGVGRATVQLYLSPNDWTQLGDHTLWDLDYISHKLGVELPPRERVVRRPRPDLRGTRRIALLCDLDCVPSPRFHIEVLRSLVRVGQARHIAVSIHALSPGDPHFHFSVERIIGLERPEGIIWFRMTPDDLSLGILNLGNRIPAVVVHGALKSYGAPILGHVFPDQSRIKEDVEQWARTLSEADGGSKDVVVVAMPREGEGRVSIRNQRIDYVHAGLCAAGLQPHLVEVSDYSAANAQNVCRIWPDALGYVCLSDEIAIAVLQLRTAVGKSTEGRVLGFDNSPLADRHGIPSFSQSLEEIGTCTWGLFTDFFRRTDNSWPEFRPTPVALKLIPR